MADKNNKTYMSIYYASHKLYFKYKHFYLIITNDNPRSTLILHTQVNSSADIYM